MTFKERNLLLRLHRRHGCRRLPRVVALSCGFIPATYSLYTISDFLSTALFFGSGAVWGKEILGSWCPIYPLDEWLSKKLENREHAVGLCFMSYNFTRVQQTFRVTTGMEAVVAGVVS
jgi:hypothetical protein